MLCHDPIIQKQMVLSRIKEAKPVRPTEEFTELPDFFVVVQPIEVLRGRITKFQARKPVS